MNATFQTDIKTLLLRPDLSRRQRILCMTAAANALLLDEETGECLSLGFRENIPVLALKEVILQNYLFCGFPNAIEGLLVLHKQLRVFHRADENYTETRAEETIFSDGEKLCRLIYQKNFDKLMANMQSLSANLHQWMLREGYGKVLSRPVLSSMERELCIVATLAALHRTRQLISHLKGALHVGASMSAIRETVFSLAPLVPQEHIDRVLHLIDHTLN